MGLLQSIIGGSSKSASQEQGSRKFDTKDARASINREVRGLCSSGRFKISSGDRDSMISDLSGLIENGDIRYRDPKGRSNAVLKITGKYCESESAAKLVRDRVLSIFS